MNKKLLAAAIAAAVALPMAAQAGVQIYGKVHVSIDYVDANNDDFGDLIDDFGDNENWSLASGAGSRDSRIGFKGSEDLGNGLKAIWKFESAVNLDNLGDGWQSGRNAYVGLASDWGTFLMGRHDTPLKISTGSLDYFGDTMADYNNTIGFEDVRAPNAVVYISPNWNGLTFAGALHASERLDDSELSDGWSLAAMYSNNGLFGSIAYEDLSDAVGFDPETDLNAFVNKKWRAGLGWEGNAFGIGFVYENQDEVFGTDNDADLYQVSAKWAFGNNVIKGMWGENDTDNVDKLSSWAIGWDHNFSKRTTAYMLYADSDLTLRTDRNANDGFYPRDASGFSLGMIHNF